MTRKVAAIAKTLRKRPTVAENLLWRHLRAKQLESFKFRRQEAIGNYIADFVCFDKRLIIEVDGGQHARRVQDDKARDEWFASQGFRVLRFWNNEVFGNTEGVLETIRKGLLGHPPASRCIALRVATGTQPPIKGGEKIEERE